jgi:hypothetical protein
MADSVIIAAQRRLLKLLHQEKERERQKRQQLQKRFSALRRAVKFISAN